MPVDWPICGPGQKGLFDDDAADESTKLADTSLVQTSDWSDKERLANEKEVLGFYLTSHPLAESRGFSDSLLPHNNRPGRRAAAD